MTPDEIRGALDDLKAVTLTVMFEGASEPVEGRIAIGSVIRNRVAHARRFSRTFAGVCVQKSQFSCWWEFGGAENYKRLLLAAETLLTGGALPLTVRETSIFAECAFLAEGIIGGQVRDNTGGAVNYYAPLAMKPVGRVPKEAVGRTFRRIGSQIFYSAL